METQSQKKWYNNTLIVTALCVLFFPLGLYALWKNESISKMWKIIVTSIIALLVLFSLGSGGNDNNSKEKYVNTKEEKKEVVEDSTVSEAKLKEELIANIEDISGGKFDGSKFRNSMESIHMEILLFSSWNNLIEKAEKSTDAKNKKLGKELEKKVKYIQGIEFPKIRKAYRDLIHSEVWENDIETDISGRRNDVLNFTGRAFHRNKNKADIQKTLYENLTLLRFKEVTFAPSEYTRKYGTYTRYTYDTPNDTELVED